MSSSHGARAGVIHFPHIHQRNGSGLRQRMHPGLAGMQWVCIPPPTSADRTGGDQRTASPGPIPRGAGDPNPLSL